jgi:hypothetical protein
VGRRQRRCGGRAGVGCVDVWHVKASVGCGVGKSVCEKWRELQFYRTYDSKIDGHAKTSRLYEDYLRT